jgi:hypothetical protein
VKFLQGVFQLGQPERTVLDQDVSGRKKTAPRQIFCSAILNHKRSARIKQRFTVCQKVPGKQHLQLLKSRW